MEARRAAAQRHPHQRAQQREGPRQLTEPRDAGAAVVEFVLVSILVTTLALVVLQVAITLHERNVLVAAAAEGARYAANADRSDADGEQRARDAVRGGLSRAIADGADVRAVPDPTQPGVVQVTISAPVPIVVSLATPFRLTVTGHALEEGP